VLSGRAGRLLGLPDPAIADGIASVRGVPGRFEAVDEGQPFTVVVDYAHTPNSLGNALRTARDLVPGRVICVFGCGGERDPGKRPLMGEIAARGLMAAIGSGNQEDRRRSWPRSGARAVIVRSTGGAHRSALDWRKPTSPWRKARAGQEIAGRVPRSTIEIAAAPRHLGARA
jgi:UDP-N-acetylmuramoyl-L-alanyl-D-glutamate--2,6-diaminopimelate ligase